MTPEEIIRQIPEWRDAGSVRYEPLTSGYSNQIYKVVADGRSCALRLNGAQNEFLGLRYEDEIEAMTLAADRHIAPAVLACENKADYLVTEFVEGACYTREQARAPEVIEKIAALLGRVHAFPYTGGH